MQITPAYAIFINTHISVSLRWEKVAQVQVIQVISELNLLLC